MAFIEHWVFGALLSFLCGALVSFINYLITRAILKKKPQMLTVSAVIRQILNVAYLAAVYFISSHTPWGVVPLLVGGVFGITLSLFLFTYLLIKKSDANGSKTEKTQK